MASMKGQGILKKIVINNNSKLLDKSTISLNLRIAIAARSPTEVNLGPLFWYSSLRVKESEPHFAWNGACLVAQTVESACNAREPKVSIPSCPPLWVQLKIWEFLGA